MTFTYKVKFGLIKYFGVKMPFNYQNDSVMIMLNSGIAKVEKNPSAGNIGFLIGFCSTAGIMLYDDASLIKDHDQQQEMYNTLFPIYSKCIELWKTLSSESAKSIKSNIAPIMQCVGNMVENGHGTTKNKLLAIQWYKQVAQLGHQNIIAQYYTHYSKSSSRFHLFPAVIEAESTNRGDSLKSSILYNFYLELAACTDLNQLINKKSELETSDNYKILSKPQGLITFLAQLIGLNILKTSSTEAFDKICDDMAVQFTI